MTRVGVWVAPALRILGLAAAAYALWRGTAWTLLAALGGFAVAFGLGVRRTPRTRALDFPHTLDLVRRAHDGLAAWAVGFAEGPIEVVGAGARSSHRGSAIVQLASVDGRAHIVREPEGTYVAVGDFPYGAGLLLAGDVAAGGTEAAVAELRRVVAGMRVAELAVPVSQGPRVARQLALVASGARTLEGVARAGADLAQQLTRRGAVVVLAGGGGRSGEGQVLALSGGVDARLAGLALKPEAPVVRAIETGVPVVTQRGEDVFGPGVPDRRREERGGSAYPLVDGRVVIGALVVMGPPLEADAAPAEELARLVVELGPRLAAAKAVHDAEQQAIRDPLTGLCNRREFERALAQYHGEGSRPAPPATLIYVDLDNFKRLNDSLGHAAGDAALKHVSYLLEAAVRDGDLVARIGGEEFAVWLPRTALKPGMEVAERIRESIAGSTWMWRSSPYVLTTSCGVAGYPEPIGDLANLQASADAALYRAKQGGRNRVEKAGAGR